MMRSPFVRSAYNYDQEEASAQAAIAIDPDEDRTKQEFLEETDINTILRRFNVTGQLPENVKAPTYGDFTEVYDFHSAANAIAEASEAFEAMPADVRRRFDNDPARFVAFCSDEANRAEATKLGLIVPPPERVEEGLQAATAPKAPVPPVEGEG